LGGDGSKKNNNNLFLLKKGASGKGVVPTPAGKEGVNF